MLGSSAFRMSVTPGGALAGPWVKNPLWSTARAVPSLDLPFADTKSLTDAVTGQSLVTFTRASSGTYVGSDGVLRTATTNLITTSEALANITGASITNNTTTAPDGLITADTLTEDTSTGAHSVNTASFNWVGNTVYTFTIFLKANTRSQAFVTFGTASNWVNSNRNARFDLSTGTVASVSGSPVVASIEAYPNGWYRCRVTATTVAAPVNSSVQIQMTISGSSSYTGDGTSGLFFWGAQLETSSSPGEYIPTSGTINSAPRFDHNPTTGESLGLLVEEQRTNLLLRSEEFDNASWTKQSSVSVSANTDIAPNGTQTADTVTADQTLGVFQGVTSVVGLNYANSVYIKAGTATSMMLRDDTGAGRHIVFNPSTGAITSTAGTLVSSGSQAVGNGWYRYWIVYAADATTVRGIIRPNSSGSAQTFFVWGAQIEAGAFPTSYIPTTTAAATRSADVASITGTAFSSWYRQDEGTMFYDGTVSQGLAGFPWFYNITDGTVNNSIGVYQFTNGIYGSVVTSGVAAIPDPSVLFSPVSGSTAKHAFAVKTSDTRAAYNGSLSSAQTSTVMPTVNTLSIGTRVTANRMTGTIRRLTYWPARLSNSTLQSITQ